MRRRIVRMFVADPDEKLSLTESVLLQTDEKLTDETDQELLFSHDAQRLLAWHNGKRKERNLPEIRLPDLVIAVNTLFQFETKKND